ncbi:hypothetical protein CUMW_016700 [Citrus unshiu]|nr:hypothetical protein CUMW_016700 [Citrus unshiu]
MPLLSLKELLRLLLSGNPRPTEASRPYFSPRKKLTSLAAPFKLALVGKFSFGRPPIDVIRKFFVALGLKGNCEISLLDPRHILIHLHLEEDYTRIWLRQSWFIDGRAMRVFKWSTTFHSSESRRLFGTGLLPFLPVSLHEMQEGFCIRLLLPSVNRFGSIMPPRDSRPTVARVLT